MFKTNVTFDFDRVLCLCSKQWRVTIPPSIWLLETGLSQLLFNGMPRVNNDLSKASTFVNYFNEKFYSRRAPCKGSRHLNHQLLIFPKKAFERVSSIWSTDETLQQTVWLHFVQLVEPVTKICSLFMKRVQTASDALKLQQCFSWYKTFLLEYGLWVLRRVTQYYTNVIALVTASTSELERTVERNNRRLCSRHWCLCLNFPCWISFGAVKSGLAMIRGKIKQNTSWVGGKVSIDFTHST